MLYRHFSAHTTHSVHLTHNSEVFFINHLNTSKSAQDVAKKCLDVNRPITEHT